GGFQALLGFGIVAEVAGGFEEEVTVDDPQSAVASGANLESETAVPSFTRLYHVAGAGSEEPAVAPADAPADALAKWAPGTAELAGLGKQGVGGGEAGGNAVQGLLFLGKTQEIADRRTGAGRGQPSFDVPASAGIARVGARLVAGEQDLVADGDHVFL